MKNILEFFRKNNIGEPPWDYDFLINLPESEYPKYLAKIFNYRTGEKLPLKYDFKQQAWIIDKKRCKTFNQKIQWIKLYGVTDLMRQCTDKVAVRDYVKEKIGEEYLKPVLQIIPAPIVTCSHSEHSVNLGAKNLDQMEKKSMPRPCDTSASNGCPPQYDGKTNDVSTCFDQIQWDKLPNSFVIKCNHGCKWHCIIKNKRELLLNKKLLNKLNNKIIDWLEQEFWVWVGFELNYKNLKSKILIESYMPANRYIEVFCFDGIPQIYADIHLKDELAICTFNKDFSYSDLILKKDDFEYMCKIKADNILNKINNLSKKLSAGFKFVRVDWMLFKNKLFFEELTFTPYSGFCEFDKKWNKKLGNYIKI